MWRAIVLSIFLFSISGCTTQGVVIDDLSVPIVDLQKVILAELPLGKREQSINGREFSSAYFILKSGGGYEASVGGESRQYIHVEILGDRRPYKLVVTAPIENYTPGGQYQVVKMDDRLAKVISRRIQKALHERRDDRNIIDDFRVF